MFRRIYVNYYSLWLRLLMLVFCFSNFLVRSFVVVGRDRGVIYESESTSVRNTFFLSSNQNRRFFASSLEYDDRLDDDDDDDDTNNRRYHRRDFGSHRRDPLWQERSKQWILLVDDEASIREAVGQLLSDRGYQVTACDSAPTALQILHINDNNNNNNQLVQLPNAIVSDVRMPEMDGLEFLKRIRQQPRTVCIPVVLLTAKGQPVDRIAGYDAGADAYLPKPFDPEELVTILDNVIERNDNNSQSNKDSLASTQQQLQELKRDVQEIKQLLAEGGAGIGSGWVDKDTGVVFLTPYERQVLELLCEGLRNKEIAGQLYLSTRRVEQLLTSMYRKTNCKNRTELVRWAISTGQVTV